MQTIEIYKKTLWITIHKLRRNANAKYPRNFGLNPHPRSLTRRKSGRRLARRVAGANCRAIICEGSLAMKPKQNTKTTLAKANVNLWNILKKTQNSYTKLRGNLNPKHLQKVRPKFPLRELFQQKKYAGAEHTFTRQPPLTDGKRFVKDP